MLHGIIKNYPCFVDYWLGFFSYVMWIILFLMFMLRYYIVSRSQRLLAAQKRINPVTPDNLIEYLARLQRTACNAQWEDVPFADEAPGLTACREMDRTRSSSLSLRIDAATPDHGRKHPAPKPENSGDESSPSGEILPGGRHRIAWSKLIISTRFCIIAVGAFASILIGALALMTALFRRLNLSHPRYNCFSGTIFLPITIISGIFNLVLGPAYVVLVWRYKDAYGIQHAMVVILAIGVASWIMTLVWRINTKWRGHHTSATIVYVFQLLFSHTYTVLLPTIKSIRFARKQREGHRSTEIMRENTMLHHTSVEGVAEANDTKQSFIVAMQNEREHQRLVSFSEKCLCSELMLFLDVYLALKRCIYDEIRAEVEHQDALARLQHVQGIPAPSIVITPADQAALASPPTNPPDSRSTEAGRNRLLEHMTPNSSSSRSSNILSTSRLSSFFEHINARLPHHSRSGTSSNQDSQVTDNSHNSAQVNVEPELGNLDTGIVETIGHAFPGYGSGYTTPVPEAVRARLEAVARTFILPRAPWEINASGGIVASMQRFVGGERIACGVLDEAKNEVVDLLYANVYIRYCQTRR